MEPVSLPHNSSWVSEWKTLVIIYIYQTVYLTIISIVAAESVSWVHGISLTVMGEWNILVAHIQSYGRHLRGVIIFVTLYVGGWVGGLLIAGTPEELLSSASYPVMFEWLPSVMKILKPWEHLTHTHCESHGDSLFLYFCCPHTVLKQAPQRGNHFCDTVCRWVNGWVYLRPIRGYFLQNSFCHPMQILL